MSGRHVLVTGAGPIGCLVVAAAKAAGDFDAEFDEALELPAARGEFDGLISAVFPVHDAATAFARAVDRGRSCKVLLEFS